MAQNLEIVVRVKSVGVEVIDSINQQLKNVKTTMAQIDFAPFVAFSQQISSIGKNIAALNRNVSNAITSVVNQTTKNLKQTVDNVNANTEVALERTYTRVAAGVLAMVAFAGETTLTLATKWIAVAKGAVGDVGAFFIHRFNDIAIFSRSLVVGTSDLISNLFKIDNTAKVAFTTLGGSLGFISRFLTSLGSFGVTVSVLSIFYRETSLFIRRFFGKGVESLTLLERVARIVTTIDTTLHSIGLTGGQILRSVGLITGALGIFFFGPVQSFLLFIPAVNSIISNLLAFFVKGRLQFFAFFGSAPAQLKLLFLDVKNFLKESLPGLTAIGKSFSVLQGNAGKAATAISKIGAGSDPFKALASTRLPFAVQFQGFSLQVRNFFKEILVKITEVLGIIAKMSGLSEDSLAKIKSGAVSSTQVLSSGLEKSVEQMERLATKLTFLQKINEFFSNLPGLIFQKFVSGFAFVFNKISGGLVSFALGIDKIFTAMFIDIGKAAVLVFRGVGGLILTIFAPVGKALFNIFGGAFNIVKSLFGGIGSLLKGVFSFFSGTPKKAATPADTSKQQAKEQEKLNKAVESGTASLQKYDNIFQELFGNVIRFRDANLSKKLGEYSGLFKTLSINVTQLGNSLKEIAAGKSVKDLDKIFLQTVKAITEIIGKQNLFAQLPKTISADDLQKIFPADKIKVLINSLEKDLQKISGKSFGNKLANFFTGLFRGKTEIVKAVDSSKIGETIVQAISLVIPQIQHQGIKIDQQLAAGISAGKPEIAQKMEKMVKENVVDYLPQSPAKRGPLVALPKMGATIVSQLAGGITTGIPTISKATAAIAERIAGYFPRSPALWGALTALPRMGLRIVEFLAAGIQEGLAKLSGVMDFVSGKLADSINRGFKIEEFSAKTGIAVKQVGLLQNAMIEVGGNVEDLSFTFNKINDVLRQALPNEEILKFRQIGINLDELRQAGDPAIATLLAVADVVQRFGVESTQAGEALQLIGVTAGSNLLPLLAKGSGELKRLLVQGAQIGNVYDENFTKAAAQLKAFLGRIEQIKNRVFDTLIGAVLPVLVDLSNEVIAVFTRNSDAIFTFLKLVGQGFGEILQSLKRLLATAAGEPLAALDAIWGVLQNIFKLVLDVIGVLLSALQTKLQNWYIEFGAFTLKFILNFLTNLFAEITRFLRVETERILLGFLEKINDFVVRNPKLSKALTKIFGFDFTVLKNEYARLQAELAKNTFQMGEVVQKSLAETEQQMVAFAKTIAKLPEQSLGPETFTNIKTAVSGFVKDLQATFKGTPFEAEISGLMERLSKLMATPFQTATEAAKESQKEIVKTLQEISDKKAEIVNIDVASAKRLAIEQLRLERDTGWKNLNLRNEQNIKIAETEDLARQARNQKEFDDLLQRQATELNEFENSLSLKLDAQARAAEVQEFMRGQELERVRLVEGQKQQAFEQTLNFFSSSAQTVSGMFNDLYELSKKNVKAFFYISKAAALAEAIVNVAQGITKALAQGGVFGIAQAALVGAAGTVQIAKIVASSLGFATGGPVSGGSGVRDDVPAMLTAGEYVQPRATVAHYGAGIMEALRQRAIPRDALANLISNMPRAIYRPSVPKFANGGAVSPAPGQQQPPAPINFQNVNIVDPALFDQYLATSVGTRKFINWLGNNQADARRALGIG